MANQKFLFLNLEVVLKSVERNIMVVFCIWLWHPLLFHPTVLGGKGTGGAETFAIKTFLIHF
jgi:hypothetical protein